MEKLFEMVSRKTDDYINTLGMDDSFPICSPFNLVTEGYTVLIKFMSCTVFDSENDSVCPDGYCEGPCPKSHNFYECKICMQNVEKIVDKNVKGIMDELITWYTSKNPEVT